jgi:hypothetical protein
VALAEARLARLGLSDGAYYVIGCFVTHAADSLERRCVWRVVSTILLFLRQRNGSGLCHFLVEEAFAKKLSTVCLEKEVALVASSTRHWPSSLTSAGTERDHTRGRGATCYYDGTEGKEGLIDQVEMRKQ